MLLARHVSEQFRAIASTQATRTALSFLDGHTWRGWTYGRLAEQAQAVADLLEAAGILPGAAVGLATQRTPNTIAAMLGVLEVGAHYVPLDAHHPTRRTRQLCEAAHVDVLVTANAPEASAPITVASAPGSVRASDAACGAQTVERGSPEAPAYVMFTSGSTGRPKGVVVPHRAITRLVSGQDYLRFDASRVFLHAAPMGFDASTLEIWGPLLHGGRCVLFPSYALPTAGALREVIAATGVTTAWLTASLFHTLVDHDVDCLADLEELIVGGEALSVPHIRRALARLPGTRLVNGYGPTENTTFTTCHAIPRDLPETAARVPIGSPIRGTTVAIVDEGRKPVRPGTAGELVAMGEGLALGYLGDPSLTAERFVDLPCADGVVRRGYLTGDLVIERADGLLEFLGRADRQVKIHGYRIEPEEVERAILDLPGVAQCRVMAHAAPGGQVRLSAYMVLREGFALEATRRRIAAALPTYMVPHHLFALAELPLGDHGKLAAEALPTPTGARASNAPERTQGRLAHVTQCWAEVLGRAPATADTNFFDAGGRSLDAIALHALLERRQGLTLDPLFIFEFTSPRRQAQALDALLAQPLAQGSIHGPGADLR